jgi:hypothetical protein
LASDTGTIARISGGKQVADRARPAPGPGGLRRPLHFKRVVRPAAETYLLD